MVLKTKPQTIINPPLNYKAAGWLVQVIRGVKRSHRRRLENETSQSDTSKIEETGGILTATPLGISSVDASTPQFVQNIHRSSPISPDPSAILRGSPMYSEVKFEFNLFRYSFIIIIIIMSR